MEIPKQDRQQQSRLVDVCEPSFTSPQLLPSSIVIFYNSSTKQFCRVLSVSCHFLLRANVCRDIPVHVNVLGL